MQALQYLAAVAALAQLLSAGPPVKIEARTSERSIALGKSVTLTATLLDAANQPAAAPKNMTLTIQRRVPGQPAEKISDITIPAGQSSASANVSLSSAGFQYLWLKNPELLAGGVNVFVRSGQKVAMLEPSPAMGARGEFARGLARGPLPAPAPAPVLSARSTITLRTSPDRTFLADGHDAATVEAFLIGPDAAPEDLRLNLYDSAGTLDPSPLIIARGQSVGTAKLSSSQPGTYSIEYLSSNPDTPLDGDKKINIKFGPAITQLLATPSPSQVSLADHADLVVQLADASGKPIATDVARDVSLAIAGGSGEIRPDHFTIPAGQFEGRATFYPSSTGNTQISVSAANLVTKQAAIPVVSPILLFVIAAAGGLIGGYLAWLRTKGQEKGSSLRTMLITGVITGFLLYWACIFLGLAGATNGALLNPLSTFAFAVIGGWAQTEVFSMVTKKFAAS